eukprot:GAHX01003908.1.p1 GENE.GAHX01003908.1~~GAHX01003908.1.p1  ORF type:complete len:503 (+),score=109.18 GAHX01003908.1:60-1568(+)
MLHFKTQILRLWKAIITTVTLCSVILNTDDFFSSSESFYEYSPDFQHFNWQKEGNLMHNNSLQKHLIFHSIHRSKEGKPSEAFLTWAEANFQRLSSLAISNGDYYKTMSLQDKSLMVKRISKIQSQSKSYQTPCIILKQFVNLFFVFDIVRNLQEKYEQSNSEDTENLGENSSTQFSYLNEGEEKSYEEQMNPIYSLIEEEILNLLNANPFNVTLAEVFPFLSTFWILLDNTNSSLETLIQNFAYIEDERNKDENELSDTFSDLLKQFQKDTNKRQDALKGLIRSVLFGASKTKRQQNLTPIYFINKQYNAHTELLEELNENINKHENNREEKESLNLLNDKSNDCSVMKDLFKNTIDFFSSAFYTYNITLDNNYNPKNGLLAFKEHNIEQLNNDLEKLNASLISNPNELAFICKDTLGKLETINNEIHGSFKNETNQTIKDALELYDEFNEVETLFSHNLMELLDRIIYLIKEDDDYSEDEYVLSTNSLSEIEDQDNDIHI